jgi:hypothetical protein
MDHPEKLAAQGTQDEEKQNKNTTQQVLDAIVLKTHKQRKEDIRKRFFFVSFLGVVYHVVDVDAILH